MSQELIELLQDFPEVNPANYGDDDVNALNALGIAAHNAIEALQAENERLKEAVAEFKKPGEGDSLVGTAARILNVKLIQERDALQAEIEELRLANEAFDQRQNWWNDKMVALEAERDALAAKLVPLEADAERYRWLSHHLFATAHGYDTTIGIYSSDSRIWINGFASYDMDAAIDAAKGGQQ